MSFANPALAKFVRKNYELVWHSYGVTTGIVVQDSYTKKALDAVRPGGGGANVRLHVVEPDGSVRSHVRGWWSASFLEKWLRAAELSDAAAVLRSLQKLSSEDGGPEFLNQVRAGLGGKATIRQLLEEAARRQMLRGC